MIIALLELPGSLSLVRDHRAQVSTCIEDDAVGIKACSFWDVHVSFILSFLLATKKNLNQTDGVVGA